MKWNRAVAIGVCVIVVLGGGFLAAPAYSAEQDGGDIPDASSALKGTFQTQDGSAVEVISDDANEGERVVLGRTKNGVAVRFLVQSTSITDANRAAMRRDVAKTRGTEGTANYGHAAKGLETFKVTADPLSPDLKWEPVSVIANTSSDASIAWTAGEFTATVSERADERSHGGEVILEDLKSGSRYVAQLESSNTEVVDGQFAAQTRTIEFETLPELVQQESVAPFTYQNWTTAYTHKTFIPESSVSAVYCGNWPTYTFGGDGRSYGIPTFDTPYETPDYRTEMFVNINWDNPAPYDVFWSHAVGASKIYNNGVLQATLYADADDMLVKDVSAGARPTPRHTLTTGRLTLIASSWT